MVILNILWFVLALGLLIFVHELGHFLAAKACGVYVDRFSLGMPPRAIGIRVGETDYCLGALPIGGYVKMAGQEDAPMTEEERKETYGHVPSERWLCNRPMWQRLLVFVAGPLMNVVLAVLLYGVVAAVGAEVPETQVDSRIGEVEAGSAASSAPMYLVDASLRPHERVPETVFDGEPDAVGWQTGDRIVSIDDTRVESIMDAAVAAALGEDRELEVRIDRPAEGGVLHYASRVTPKVMEGEDLARFGISMFHTAVVREVEPGSPAEAIGIKRGDIIQRLNGQWVDLPMFVAAMEKVAEGDPVRIELIRDEKPIEFQVTPVTVGRVVGVEILGWSKSKGDPEDALPEVVGVDPEVEESCGLQARDIILEINGEPATMTRWAEIQKVSANTAIEVTVRRPALLLGLLRHESIETRAVDVSAVRAVGVALSPRLVFHRVAPAMVVPEAFRLAYQDVARTLRTVAMLVSGTVSPKNLGGPVMIYQATTQAAQAGLFWFLKITAFISVNLCVFNLLPLPILDGGQVVLLALEAIRRKPVPVKFVERFQQVGLVLIVALMLFVTYNDILRGLKSLAPW
ncbi:MAG TPA: site-2 protease family protein [Candidatus Hydrogenedentes bacterium]|nr:site-2 protease family protein [Candidatus Hydrogenedentota bacterium]HPG69823.1 site-2 protease family protein [Candidatus Hydrogenedentota bacterium]